MIELLLGTQCNLILDCKPSKLSRVKGRTKEVPMMQMCRGGKLFVLTRQWLIANYLHHSRSNEEGLQVHVHVNGVVVAAGSRGGLRGRRGRGEMQAQRKLQTGNGWR